MPQSNVITAKSTLTTTSLPRSSYFPSRYSWCSFFLLTWFILSIIVILTLSGVGLLHLRLRGVHLPQYSGEHTRGRMHGEGSLRFPFLQVEHHGRWFNHSLTTTSVSSEDEFYGVSSNSVSSHGSVVMDTTGSVWIAGTAWGGGVSVVGNWRENKLHGGRGVVEGGSLLGRIASTRWYENRPTDEVVGTFSLSQEEEQILLKDGTIESLDAKPIDENYSQVSDRQELSQSFDPNSKTETTKFTPDTNGFSTSSPSSSCQVSLSNLLFNGQPCGTGTVTIYHHRSALIDGHTSASMREIFPVFQTTFTASLCSSPSRWTARLPSGALISCSLSHRVQCSTSGPSNTDSYGTPLIPTPAQNCLARFLQTIKYTLPDILDIYATQPLDALEVYPVEEYLNHHHVL